jgi:hypothetical protein
MPPDLGKEPLDTEMRLQPLPFVMEDFHSGPMGRVRKWLRQSVKVTLRVKVKTFKPSHLGNPTFSPSHFCTVSLSHFHTLATPLSHLPTFTPVYSFTSATPGSR